MSKFVNLIKLSVGTDTPENLAVWQAIQMERYPDGLPRHVTRMWPKREAEILNGGSIYWVIKGVVQCRQKILRLEEVQGDDGVRRCAIVLDPTLLRTTAAPRRAFQGWRYLKPEDSPADLGETKKGDSPLPAELSAALAEIGVL